MSNLWFPMLLLLFSAAFVLNAWVVDDAYITFRTVDNFVHGFGLTWNVGERVQAYSHPFWMFLLSACYAVTRDIFYTSLAVSFVLCLGTFGVVYHAYRNHDASETWRASLLVVLVLASKAAMDFSSSGLENPLSYFLAALFLCRFLLTNRSVSNLSPGDIRFLFFIAALAFFNRQDTLLFYLPALLTLLFVQAPRLGWKLFPTIIVATLPATLWALFSLFYYGSPFPNTAFAKAFGPGIPAAEKMARGLEYMGNSVAWDLGSHVMVIAACGMALWRRSVPGVAAMLGVLLYLGFVVTGASSATHMSGRFLALPFVFSIIVLTRFVPGTGAGKAFAGIAAASLVFNPMSSLRMGTPWYGAPDSSNPSTVDTNFLVHREGAALIDVFDRRPLPDHRWFHAGTRFRKHPARVTVGGPNGGEPVGYFGFAAGPEKYIIDYLGLSAPLLARLPTCNNHPAGSWKSGHFYRDFPRGYIASVANSKNQLQDENLKAYYAKLLRITRGPLWSWQRLEDIVGMNLGRYDHLLEDYIRRSTQHFEAKSCRPTVRKQGGPVLPGSGAPSGATS